MDGENEAPIINPIHPFVVDRLDEDVKVIYMKHQARRLRADQVPFAEFDADRAKFAFPRAAVSAPPVAVGDTAETKLAVSGGEVDVRVYWPLAKTSAAAPALPGYVHFHGGGFVLGGLDDDDPFCRHMCREAHCIVVNVAYRLAPAFPHPTPTLDGWEVLRQVMTGGGDGGRDAALFGMDRTRVAVGGFSAGGCIAAAVALLARDDPAMPPLALQLLLVPVLDARYVPMEESQLAREEKEAKDGKEKASRSLPYDSYLDCQFAPMLPMARLVWFYNLWLGTHPDEREARARDVRASPMAAERFEGLAPASIHAAEVDPLRSEAEAYQARLAAAGVPCEMEIYKGMVHPFAQWDAGLAAAGDLVRNASTALKKAFWRGSERFR